ncbi:polymorphic toxin-type HINT domain-containing protein [Streptomyces ortus]|uniref:Polymorphic toxin-type HINT domain-containing protein n=1 Tax=Streptomyces ortus TaxID=2867268 RepID=A0ABT3VBC7_9ACTN|nr:polymorphic toxin-type HINT domain-containing protein [Streptomyces ortus]MCX4237245.1 polymorphic toxin-type HINT domain-containing protein [Streptomyces ortus]
MNGRSSKRLRRLRRRVALASAVVMVGTLLQAAGVPIATAADIKQFPELPASDKPVPGTTGKVKPRKVTKGPRTPLRAPEAAWPKAAKAVVDLRKAGTKGTAGESVRAQGLPVILDTQGGPSRKPAHGAVEARVMSRKAAVAAGVDGVLLSLRPKSEEGIASKPGGKSTARIDAGRVRATVDYSAFADAYGGGYASRLTFVELPACALTTPGKEQCRAVEPLATVNDSEKETLTAQDVALSGNAPTVLAAVANEQGMGGDYKATSLSPSSTWSTNLNTGDFSWAYAMPVPEVPGGLKPNVGLSYASGSIDGRTGNTNNQASWVGDGFDLSPGYIERRYKSCADDDVKNADGNTPGDVCWGYDNAFISFNGKGGELVPNGKGSWKLQSDDGTKIDRLESSERGNGDNEGEHWRVTTPDGTQYFFGYNRLPGWSDGKETTDSTWTLPVFGDDSGEPCHESTFAGSWCNQAWRWNLDYVVDVRGNALAYYYDKESNSYGRNLEESDNTRYVRGGTLDRIEYGLKPSSMYSSKALGKVDFTDSERCLPNTATTCSSIDTDAAHWYDTPWDLNCDSAEDCDQGRFSPAFFTCKRLTGVTTQVYDGSAYKNVDSWKLTHRWGMADIDYQLLLDSVQHTGHTADTAITQPKTTFAYEQLANRLDETGDGYAPFIKDRLSAIADEYGGQVEVDYSAAACKSGALPSPATNATRCFPQYIGGSSTDDPERHWFNKYVVTSVNSIDRTGGAPDEVTSYDYMGDAAWHYDDDDGLTKEKFKTWSQWRGYGHVRVQTGGLGGPSAMETQADTYFLRGMDADRKAASGGTRDVTVTLGEGEGDPITDHASTAGFSYKTVSYSGPNGKVLTKTINRPWHHETAKKTRDWGTVTANFTGTSHSKTFTSLDDGVGTKWRVTSTANTYDTVAGRLTNVDDFGDNSTADDNRCTRTTYATNTSSNILMLPSRVETVGKACDVAAGRPGDVLSDVRSAYDGAAYEAAPTKGDATNSALLRKYDGSNALYVESGATFDDYGRQLTTTDLTADVKVTAAGALTRTARTDGRTTKTERTPATGFATTTKVTTPPVKTGDASTAQTSITTHDIRRGLPLTQTDTNGKVTTFVYDALGRSAKVWLADRLTGQTPSYEFTYTVTDSQPVAVGTKTLGNNGAQRTSYLLYDGFLRPRQTQEAGPDGGGLVTDTFYDERGLAGAEFATYFIEKAPSVDLFKPNDALSVETQIHYSYDGLGRQTEAREVAGSGGGGTVLNTTKTIYGGDRTTVIPPVGGTAVTTLTDSRGQNTEVRQHHARSVDAAYDTTTYKYTPRGELDRVTDAEGNSWNYEYDLLGQQTAAHDPDAGTSRSVYDDRGQLTSSTDERNITLAYSYDGLGRQTEVRKDSPSGPLRSAWVYDTVSGAKGHLAKTIRYDGSNAYTAEVVAYDRLYRPLRTSVTIPATEGGLQGTYISTNAYDVSGLLKTVGYPKAGSLAATTLTYTYEDETLRPTVVTSGQGVKASTTYGWTGRPLKYELSNSGGKTVTAVNTYEKGTQRLATSTVSRQDVAGVDQSSTYRYDEAGNILAVSDVSRSGTDTQCFTYDPLRRLSEAWTQDEVSCAEAPGGSTLGGPAPYWTSYTYGKTGQRLTETLHDSAGNAAKDTKREYDYPDPGTAQAHALSSITSTGPTGTAKDSYAYDAAGNTTARTQSGDKQSLTWNEEGSLAKVTEPVEGGADQVTEYLYDTDGNRLIGRTPTETTLYLGSTEITLSKGSTTPTATRYFDLGGGHQAVQKDDGSVSFTLADYHGTAQLAVEAASQKLSQQRTLPFGGTRGGEVTDWPGTKGFVGGTNDTKSTGLTHLGAREYDPDTGRFLSVDPLLETDKPQTLNGYTYGAQNPLFFSDATGLGLACGSGFSEGCGTGVQTHGDGSLSIDGRPTGGGNIYAPPSGNALRGGEALGPVTIKPYGSSITIQGVYVPTQEELAATFPYYHENTDYQHNLENWARSKCTGVLNSNDFCHAVGELGWFGGPASVDVLEVLGVRSYVDCYKGKGCKDAATDAAISGATLAVGKLAKIGFKVFKAAIKRGDNIPIGCLVGAAHSFTAGTHVLLADGTSRPIEDVKIGDKVTVTDPRTNETTVKEVVATIVTEDDKHFVDLSIATDGGTNSLISTSTHPFWSDSEDAWVDAGDLRAGMAIRTADGSKATVQDTRAYAERQRTYDLTINEVHTYYVLAGATPVLVHNTGPACGLTAETLDQAWATWNTPANLEHVIDPAKHGFGDLVARTGGREEALRSIMDSLHGATDFPAAGRYEVNREIAGETVTIRGAVVNGVPRLGTAFIPGKFPG